MYIVWKIDKMQIIWLCLQVLEKRLRLIYFFYDRQMFVNRVFWELNVELYQLNIGKEFMYVWI